MLKRILILLLTSLLLVGCKPIDNNTEEVNKYSVLSLKGMSSLPLLGLEEDADLTVTSSIDDIYNAFKEGETDIIFAPIYEGVKACNDTDDYRLLSITGYSSLVVASFDPDFSKGTMAVYATDEMTKVMVNYLETTDFFKYDIVWYDDSATLIDDVLNNEVDACLVNEIDFTTINSSSETDLNVIDTVNSCYEYHTGYSSVPTYGMFIKNSVISNDQTNLVNFAKTIKNNISTFKDDKSSFNDALNNSNLSNLGFDNRAILSAAYNTSGIDFAYASVEVDNLKNILDIAEISYPDNLVIQ